MNDNTSAKCCKLSSLIFVACVGITFVVLISVSRFSRSDLEQERNEFSRLERDKDKADGDDDDDVKVDKQKMDYHAMIADRIDAKSIDENLKYFAGIPHIAGSDEGREQADWVANKFRSYGFDKVEQKKYKVLLSYPNRPGEVTLLTKKGQKILHFKSVETSYNKWENDTRALPPFIAYSQSGTFEGKLVYANYADEKDFHYLRNQIGIKLKEVIALVRYGKLSRSEKLKNAEKAGVKGVIIFSDPEDYSPSDATYPDSWYLPEDGVQRGTVLRMRGDPLSNGYPALDGFHRWNLDEVSYFPSIPILPIGYGNAAKILRELDGEDSPSTWKGSLNVTYKINSVDKIKVRIKVENDRKDREIVNVIGAIEGAVEPDRLIILGNHRDAWVFGAADPSSGTATMMEVARAFGWLKKKGWKPRRTILLCSWDAEEFGLIGSTEWVEEHAKLLNQRAVVYINVDTAVEGNHTINLKSTPHLRDAFYDIVKMFKDPDDHDKNLYETWVAKKGNPNVFEPDASIFRFGSDYMPFFGDLGIPALDFRYSFDSAIQGVVKFPVYHSIHDNVDWLKRFVDPDMRYHVTIGKLWTQISLYLADAVILPFNLRRYGESLMKKSKEFESIHKNIGKPKAAISIEMLRGVCKKFKQVTFEFHKRLESIDKTDPIAVRMANDKLMLFERSFVLSEDIPGENTRHLYHSTGVKQALHNVMDEKPGSLDDLNIKMTAFVYHIKMAIMSLENVFMNDETQKNTL